jgi:NAD(P)-dependent dehydrogenase (short-subunit alcohol dehydrogenase family)
MVDPRQEITAQTLLSVVENGRSMRSSVPIPFAADAVSADYAGAAWWPYPQCRFRGRSHSDALYGPLFGDKYDSATKYALEGYSESLDHEVREFGVRVAVIEPAATKMSLNPVLSRPTNRSQSTIRAAQNISGRLSIRWPLRRRLKL